MKLKPWLMGVAFVAFSAVSASAANIIYSSHTQDTHSDNTYVGKRFFDRITEATGSEQTFQIMGGGVLASGANALSAVKTGAVDTAMLIYSYMPSDLPTMTLLGDLYGSDLRVSAAATTETMLLDCPQCQEEQERQNVFVLQNTATDNYSFICGSSGVATLADVKGKKIRGSGAMARLAASLGATPVNATYAEIYEGLQRGALDCSLLDAGNLEAGQFWDVAKFVTPAPLGTFNSIGFAAINRDLWKSFTPKQRRAWLDSAAISVSDYTFNSADRVKRALVTAASEKGMTVLEPDEELLKAIGSFWDNEMESLVAAAEGRGVKDAKSIVDAYRKNYAKWEKIVAEISEGEWTEAEWQKFGERIRDEVYAKVSVD